MNALTRFTSGTPVKFDVMNKMCTEIEARESELEQEIQDKVTSAELTEFAETLSAEFTSRDVKITALEDKNIEQDTAISEKVKVNNVATNVNFIRDENGNISKILVDNEEINLAGKLSATTVQDEIWEVI